MLIKLRSLSPFDLYKISRQSLYVQGLDTSRLLTRGEPFNFRNLMRRVSPSVDLAAVIWDEVESESTFGQIEKNEYSDYAQISYLGGLEQPDSRVIAGILEALAVTAGEWNAFGILAELPEDSPLFEGFRIAGFSIWSRHRFTFLIQLNLVVKRFLAALFFTRPDQTQTIAAGNSALIRAANGSGWSASRKWPGRFFRERQIYWLTPNSTRDQSYLGPSPLSALRQTFPACSTSSTARSQPK